MTGVFCCLRRRSGDTLSRLPSVPIPPPALPRLLSGHPENFLLRRKRDCQIHVLSRLEFPWRTGDQRTIRRRRREYHQGHILSRRHLDAIATIHSTAGAVALRVFAGEIRLERCSWVGVDDSSHDNGGGRTEFHSRRGGRMVSRELDFRRIGLRVGVETVAGVGEPAESLRAYSLCAPRSKPPRKSQAPLLSVLTERGKASSSVTP